MDPLTMSLPDVSFAVDAVKAREFATALGAELERDEDGATLVPVGMLFFVLCRDSAALFAELGLPWERALFGGVRFEYARQARTGERLLARSRVVSYREREREAEHLGILDLETSYYDVDGGLVVREISTLIARGGLKSS